ncbi:MAG: DUF2934 domain-containing protein [Pseudomonadota bacterium]
MTRQTIDEIRVRKLAYYYWQVRGEPLGSPEVDWLAAQATLGSTGADSDLQLPGEYSGPDEGEWRQYGSA